MQDRLNHLGQAVGFALEDWRPACRPARALLRGRLCDLEPLDPERHARALFAANALDEEGRNWTYLPYGPFAELASYRAWMEETCLGEDPLFFAIVERRLGAAVGVASYLRVAPLAGSIEVGHLNYSPQLQRRAAATEAMYLMMRHAFALGYRRYEWKCDSLNAPSRRAAQRYGFQFEGVFRQATHYKGRNRDTAWFSVIDREWPALDAAYRQWLDPDNFDPDGRQRRSLASCLPRSGGAAG